MEALIFGGKEIVMEAIKPIFSKIFGFIPRMIINIFI
ncbi:hypothetical protein CPZ17_11065 [Staphylococcus epidermidis]|nr:hypothetical protein CPZ17_11065 [Staphylococcus epidermidis]